MENKHLYSKNIVAFDLETSDQYPLQAEVCEMAAVKYFEGKIVDSFQSLVKVSKPMGEKVIGIHGITNEMLIDAPNMSDVVAPFREFIDGCHVVAHHSPFDLSFMAIEFEKADLSLPEEPAFCSSLLSQKILPNSPNHRLQTLIQYLKIEQGTAHRALDDSKACLEVALNCFNKFPDYNVDQFLEIQGGAFYWKDFSINELCKNPVHKLLVEACNKKEDIQITYAGGSKPGQARTVTPVGIIRHSHKSDSFVAFSGGDTKPKRYYMEKITKATF